jgi:hypothetical protein
VIGLGGEEKLCDWLIGLLDILPPKLSSTLSQSPRPQPVYGGHIGYGTIKYIVENIRKNNEL